MEEKEDEDGAQKRHDRDENPKKTSNHVALLLSFSIGILGIFIYIIVVDPLTLQQDTSSNFYENYAAAGSDNIDPQVLDLFVSYDENLDGKISPKEFIQIAKRLQLQGSQGSHFLSEPVVEENWDLSGEQITLNGSFKPLVLSSMTKFSSSSYPGFEKPIEGLKAWQKMFIPQATYPVSAFSIFLPPEDKQLGESWYIIEPRISKYGPSLSSYRYVPPPVRGTAVLIHRLLAMFHPRSFVFTRFGPQGTAALMQAENDKYLKIYFRIHGEFQLNKPPLAPFWFSPAQFAGSIVISRDKTHIKSFHVAVPTNKSLNVDMEWLQNRENDNQLEPDKDMKSSPDDSEGQRNDANMEVDIGFLPLMELRSIGKSVLKDNETLEEEEGSPTETKEPPTDKQEIKWNSEISKEKAENLLAAFFYPFKKVTYHPFKEAFQLAKDQHKPVHHILLWGALDDQSC